MKKIIFLFLTLTFCINLLYGQWQQVGDFYYGDIHYFSTIGTKIIAGTEDGVYISNDYGENWAISSNGMTDLKYRLNVQSLAVTENSIIASIPDGMFLSADSGLSWKITSGDFHAAEMFIEGSTVYAASNKGVFVSSDCGSSWHSINDVVVGSIAKFGSRLFVGTPDSGAFVSSDNGKSWMPINNGLPNWKGMDRYYEISSLVVNGNHLFAGTSAGVYLLSDKGESWTALNYGLPKDFRHMNLTTKGAIMFVQTSGNVYLSTDNAQNWNLILTGNNIGSIGIIGDFVFVGTCGEGLWRCRLDSLIINRKTTELKGKNSILIEKIEKSYTERMPENNGDDEIYKQVILDINRWADCVGRKLPVVVNSTIGNKYLFDHKFSDIKFQALKQTYFDILDSTTYIDFIIKNKRKTTVDSFDIMGGEIKYIDTTTLYALYSKADPDFGIEKELEILFAGTMGYLEFSRIGYNTDQTQALVYYGETDAPFAGVGCLVLYELKNGKWTLYKEYMLWIS